MLEFRNPSDKEYNIRCVDYIMHTKIHVSAPLLKKKERKKNIFWAKKKYKNIYRIFKKNLHCVSACIWFANFLPTYKQQCIYLWYYVHEYRWQVIAKVGGRLICTTCGSTPASSRRSSTCITNQIHDRDLRLRFMSRWIHSKQFHWMLCTSRDCEHVREKRAKRGFATLACRWIKFPIPCMFDPIILPFISFAN